MSDAVDLLAIAAHRDDVELTCGGTLAKAVRAGHRVGILDLTEGEMGTRGDAATRAAEADKAAKTLGVTIRLNAGMRDAHLENDEASRKRIVELIRRTRPRVVILPFPVGRHPDHRIASELGRDACYLAGLAKYEPDKGGEAHRPYKLLYALAYAGDSLLWVTVRWRPGRGGGLPDRPGPVRADSRAVGALRVLDSTPLWGAVLHGRDAGS